MKRLLSAFVPILAGALALSVTGCPQFFNPLTNSGGSGGSGDNTNTNSGGGNTDNTGDSGYTVVKTDIGVHSQAMVRAGNDLIAFGTGGSTGVDYIIPSGQDATGRTIPNSSNFKSYSLAVGGRNIFLTDSNFQVTVFNVDTQDQTAVDLGEVRLVSIPASQWDAGHIQANGDYCAVICEETDVTDGQVVKVIDVSTGLPSVISFTASPITNGELVKMVAVNESTQQVVAATSSKFYVFDITNPTGSPTEYDADSNGVGSGAQMQFDGTHVIYQDDAGFPNAKVLTLSNASITTLGLNPSTGSSLAIAGGAFGYFLDRDSSDSIGSHLRSAIGTDITTSPTIALVDDFIDGSTTNNGAFGFGQSIALTSDGTTWFLGGLESIGSGEYLQVSTGGAFNTIADPTGADTYGCPGTDVFCGEDVLAFKVGSQTDTTIGYILLNDSTAVSSSGRR
ncbi:MAG: hypothetical protein HZB38_09225 [Planctomycetes bacterium]|nr:hypothetical protein [Planctomycetota bacterium]